MGLIKLTIRGLLWCLNGLFFRVQEASTDDVPLARVRRRSRKRTDINDHLERLYQIARESGAQLIVELGVRTGESSFALETAVRETGAWLISVDLEETTFASTYEKWRFVQADDIVFADQFPEFAKKTGCPRRVDLLFLDTTHVYQDTVRELAAWLPLMAPEGILVLHDTNMARIFRRKDRSFGFGWNNRRGVIRAVEELVGRNYDETRPFQDEAGGFVIDHVPWCNGLTVLKRIRNADQ